MNPCILQLSLVDRQVGVSHVVVFSRPTRVVQLRQIEFWPSVETGQRRTTAPAMTPQTLRKFAVTARNVSGWKSAAIAVTTCALAQRVEVANDEVRSMGSKSRLL